MKKSEKWFQFNLTIIFLLVCAVMIVPLWMVISVSISDDKDIVEYGYAFLPRNLDWSAYRFVFRNPQSVINAYKVTSTFSVITTIFGVLFMSMIAYPLSKRTLKGRQIIAFFIYFTMLFNGGLVPTYILTTQYLHLDDTIWVYILPALINPWHMFMLRSFFSGIPFELSESMLVDGANEYIIFLRLILPLSKPVLATVALLIFLARWNDWYNSMLYINDPNLVSLQYLLQRIVQNIKLMQDASMSGISVSDVRDIPSETVRMAMAVIVAGPATFVFLFFQKYFVKGLTVGSVKG